MEYIAHHSALFGFHRFGNKAMRLAQLARSGFAVPDFFVVDPAAAAEEWANPDATHCPVDLVAAIGRAVRRLARDGGTVAVRSSAVDEDGARNSYAGQLDSFLDVSHADVAGRVADVWRSAAGDRVMTYREAHGIDRKINLPAVIVQKMVRAQAAGVAFAADPVSGDASVAIVAAGGGLGERLVSGEVSGDLWRVNHRGHIDSREIEAGEPVLRDREVRKVARLVRKVSRAVGRPQDIEWAIAGRRLFLLQSRDITTLGSTAPNLALWDNSNIVESYGGVTTPLTFSVARSAYSEAYRHLCRVLGVGETAIQAHDGAFEQMIGLIQGRVYYNILNWYRLLMLVPGFRFNHRFMEQMMGVTRGLPAGALPRPARASALTRLRAMLGMARVTWRLVAKLAVHRRRVRSFHRHLDQCLRPVSLAALPVEDLLRYYDRLQAEVIPAWDTPLINDLYCMIFHGALRVLCERWLPPELAGVHNDLVSGEAGIVSLEPVRRMQALARIAATDTAFTADLCAGSKEAIAAQLSSQEDFSCALNSYLDRFGDRCLDELKLESRTLLDDPLPLLRAVGQIARTRPGTRAATVETSLAASEARVERLLRERPIRARLFRLVVKLARARVRDRENLRFERTRVYGRVRRIWVEIGKRLAGLGVIASPDDIFWLDVGEIRSFLRGTGSSAALAAVATARREEFRGYAEAVEPPRRFVTRGPAQLRGSMQPVEPDVAIADGDLRKGLGCSPGIVRGAVRIVRDPRVAEIRAGDVVVAERTDPGWVTVFPLVAGLIMERGSPLSHSAIVAREMGLPAVVAVVDACLWLRDGDWVELDGAAGTVRRLVAAPDANAPRTAAERHDEGRP